MRVSSWIVERRDNHFALQWFDEGNWGRRRSSLARRLRCGLLVVDKGSGAAPARPGAEAAVIAESLARSCPPNRKRERVRLSIRSLTGQALLGAALRGGRYPLIAHWTFIANKLTIGQG